MSCYEQYIPTTKNPIKIALLGDNSKYDFIKLLKNSQFQYDIPYMKNSVEISEYIGDNYKVQFFIIGELITQQIKESYMKMSQIHITFVKNSAVYVDYQGSTERIQIGLGESPQTVLNNIVSNHLCGLCGLGSIEEKIKPRGLLKYRLIFVKAFRSIWCNQ